MADDRAADAEGLDGPGGGRRRCRSKALGARTRCLSPTRGRTTSTAACSRSGCGATGPRSCSTRTGGSSPELAALPPRGTRRMSANPHANGGELLRDLVLPDFRDYAVDVPEPGTTTSEATRVLGAFLRDVIARNPETFRLVRPRRDGLQPAGRRLRGHRQGLGGARPCPSTSTSPRTAASWKCCPSTSARAGSRATCSPAGTACSTATRPSSTSSTRCSTSTPSG